MRQPAETPKANLSADCLTPIPAKPCPMGHKFKIGQLVDYNSPRGLYAPRGSYLVVAQMPLRDGEPEYHIRHPNEMHERVVREDELSVAQIVTATADIAEYMGYRLETRPLGKGWRVLIYPPGTKSALSEYASDLEKGSKEAVIKRAKEIVDAHLHRILP
jgi:hypothetical protein